MKKHHRGLTIPTLALLCYLTVPAYAIAGDTVVNIPASAAQRETEAFYNCEASTAAVFSPTPAPAFCEVHFPLTIPAGRTVKQISVVHGTAYPLLPNPTIGASLYLRRNDGWQDVTFSWGEDVIVPNGTLETSSLMEQFQQSDTDPPVYQYPDAFVVQPDTMYSVRVQFGDGSYITGIQVTYN